MNNKSISIEKKQLRSISNKIGITYLLAIFISVFLIIFLHSTSMVVQQSIISVCSLLGFFILIKICPSQAKYVILFKKPKKYTSVYLLIGVPVYLFAQAVFSIIHNMLKISNINSVQPKILNSPDLLLYTIILAPFVEEFIFRGAILGLLRKYGDKFAILISSIFFGLIHGNAEQFIYAFILGLYLGFIVIKTNSLFTSIILHILANTFSSITIITDLLFGNSIENIHNIVFYLLITLQSVLLIMAVIAFIRAKKKNPTILSISSLSPGKTTLKLREKIFAFIFNPGMLLMLGYIIFNFIILGSMQI